MDKVAERLRLWITNEPTIQRNSIDTVIERILLWLLRHLVPVLLMALVINLIILCASTVEATMSPWFWLKDPVSVVAAYLICKSLRGCRIIDAKH